MKQENDAEVKQENDAEVKQEADHDEELSDPDLSDEEEELEVNSTLDIFVPGSTDLAMSNLHSQLACSCVCAFAAFAAQTSLR